VGSRFGSAASRQTEPDRALNRTLTTLADAASAVSVSRRRQSAVAEAKGLGTMSMLLELQTSLVCLACAHSTSWQAQTDWTTLTSPNGAIVGLVCPACMPPGIVRLIESMRPQSAAAASR
jgi:hypothetical protein